MKPTAIILTIVVLIAIAGFFLSEGTDTTIREPEQSVTADEPAVETAPTDTAVSETDPVPAAAEDDTNTFTVTGVNYAFDVEEMTVTEGDTVTINFSSEDGFHDWVVDAFDAATEKVRPGTPTSVTFVADQAGTFEYYCSVGNHREQGMVGTLTVEPK